MRSRSIVAGIWILALAAAMPVPPVLGEDDWSEEQPIPLTDPPAFSAKPAPFAPIVVEGVDGADDVADAPAAPPAKPTVRAGRRNESFENVDPQDLLDDSANSPSDDAIHVEPLDRPGTAATDDPPAIRPTQPRANVSKPAATAKSRVITAVPTLQVETATPAEPLVGKPAKVTITLKNLGQAAADNVQVRTTVPAETELVKTQPNPQANSNGELLFDLGTLSSQASRQIELQLTPRRRGQIELPAIATFSVSSRAALHVRRPNLEMSCVAPPTAQFGETVTFELELINTGDGACHEIVVTPQVDPAAAIAGRSDRPLEIGSLGPGQKKTVPVAVRAVALGDLEAAFTATDAGGGEVSASAIVQVQRAVIEATVHGPNVISLKGEGVFELLLVNPGDAPAKNIEAICTLPAGLKVTLLERDVQFDGRKRTLTWRVPSLDGGDSISLAFKAQATTDGDLTTTLAARADGELAADSQHVTTVISRPDLRVQVVPRNGPLDVNAAARFEISVQNAGTKTAEDVRLRVALSEGLDPVASDDYADDGGELVFPALTLAAGESQKLEFQAVGREAGDQIVRVILESGSATRPLAVESSAFFYDRQETRVGSRASASTPREPNPLPAR